MDRAERVAGELMQHTPDSYDSRGERQTAISAILRREFQAVWEEAAGLARGSKAVPATGNDSGRWFEGYNAGRADAEVALRARAKEDV